MLDPLGVSIACQTDSLDGGKDKCAPDADADAPRLMERLVGATCEGAGSSEPRGGHRSPFEAPAEVPVPAVELVAAACQTDSGPLPHREAASAALWRDLGSLGVDGRRPREGRPDRREQPALEASSPWSSDLPASPRTDAGSEGNSVATTAAPGEPRPKGRWATCLDVETQRIARIMRGARSGADDSDGSSSSRGQ